MVGNALGCIEDDYLSLKSARARGKCDTPSSRQVGVKSKEELEELEPDSNLCIQFIVWAVIYPPHC